MTAYQSVHKKLSSVSTDGYEGRLSCAGDYHAYCNRQRSIQLRSAVPLTEAADPVIRSSNPLQCIGLMKKEESVNAKNVPLDAFFCEPY
uniref:Uncharacterized protein n=1 Tax=Setaria digitata TaxID=48799 RepID=A0A915PLW7_9BILA